VPSQNPRMQQQAQRCPACGGEPMRGSKKGSPTCAVCHGDMATSPLGKQAMAQASKAGAQKVKQAMAQRDQMAQREQMQRRAIAGGAAGMRPGMGGPGMPQGQGQPQVDPRMLAALIARSRGGR